MYKKIYLDSDSSQWCEILQICDLNKKKNHHATFLKFMKSK